MFNTYFVSFTDERDSNLQCAVYVRRKEGVFNASVTIDRDNAETVEAPPMNAATARLLAVDVTKWFVDQGVNIEVAKKLKELINKQKNAGIVRI